MQEGPSKSQTGVLCLTHSFSSSKVCEVGIHIFKIRDRIEV